MSYTYETPYDTLLSRMQETYRSHTGVAPDDASDIGIRLKVLAGELSTLYGQLEELNYQLFPQTSTGKYLDMHAQLRGQQRRPATNATGTVVFRRREPAEVPVEIPAETLLAAQSAERDGQEQEYITTKEAKIPKGHTWVEVEAKARNTGEQGNLAAEKIDLLLSSVPGITHVSNPLPFTGGTAKENDEQLRNRLLHSYRHISNGSNAAYYYDLAASTPGVAKAAVLSRKRGRGTVDVVITPSVNISGQSLCDTLAQTLATEKEINVDTKVYVATERNLGISVRLSVEGEYNFQKVAAACKTACQRFIAALAIGEPLRIVQLGNALLAVEGVENYSIDTPVADVIPLPHEVLVISSIAVEGM